MFSGLMINAWEVATVVGVVAGVVGLFTVLRGAAFVAHAVPNAAFAGAAGATLVGVSTVAGLGVFAALGVAAIAWLGRSARRDVATALVIVVMLGLGSLFLSFSGAYEPQVEALLFGELLGVSQSEIVVTAVLGALAVLVVAVLFRPLLFSSALSEVAEARGIKSERMELAFLAVVALVTTTAVPVVGTLLMFSLMIAPAAAARSLAARPLLAAVLAVGLSLATVWTSIAASYWSGWPIGFFVGAVGAGVYLVSRGWVAWRTRARSEPTPAALAAP